MENSLCEKPERHASRRLSDHLVLEGRKQKVHSLVDKVYSRKNLKLAWERVRANQGASGALLRSPTPVCASLPTSLPLIGLLTRLLAGTQTGLLGSRMNLPYRAVSKHLGTMGE